MSKRPLISFGIIADLQYCDAPVFKKRYYRNSIDKLNKVAGNLNQQSLDFVANLGDLIDKDWESYDRILPHFDALNAPLHHVLGNHDFEVSEAKKQDVAKKIGTKPYYHFSLKGWRFIVLDGNEISTFANLPGSQHYQLAEKLLHTMELEGKINGNFWNGGIGEEQLAWLEQILYKADQKEEKVIIFCHYPIYPVHRHNLLNAEEVLTLLKNYKGVKMWLNGHNHDGNYGFFEDIHFVNVKGLVEGEHDLVWSIVHLFPDHIEIIGYGKEISARLAIKT